MAQPRPLIFQLYTVSQRAGELVAAALQGSTIRPEDAPLYSVLDRSGPLTPTELARRLGVGQSTLSYRLKSLEARGEVARKPNPDDGRSALLELTPNARSRWQTTIPEFTEALRRAERRITLPHDDVAATLDALARAMDAELAGAEASTRAGRSRVTGGANG